MLLMCLRIWIGWQLEEENSEVNSGMYGLVVTLVDRGGLVVNWLMEGLEDDGRVGGRTSG